MAKKIYHIPLDITRVFIKENKSILNKLLNDKQYLEYTKRFGKSYYDKHIEEFIIFFKIDKNITYALKTINYLSSNSFFDDIFELLNFSQFDFKSSNISQRDFFYGFCCIMTKEDEELFEYLLHKLFIHFHATLNNDTNINIDFKDMAKDLANTKKMKLKESFGEDELGGYFKININDKVFVNLKGKSIKTLRKKAYKKLFYYLLDFSEDDSNMEEKYIAYELTQEMKSF